MYKTLLIALLLASHVAAAFAVDGRADKQLIMGYNSSAKIPLIANAPDNSGAYIDLYTRLAEKIG